MSAGRDPATVTLVAVSKAQPAELMREVATAGVTDFGESYIQEALPKLDQLSDQPIEWHFIGGLQSNKATEGRRRSDLPQLAPTPTCWYLELKVSLTRASSSVG